MLTRRVPYIEEIFQRFINIHLSIRNTTLRVSVKSIIYPMGARASITARVVRFIALVLRNFVCPKVVAISEL